LLEVGPSKLFADFVGELAYINPSAECGTHLRHVAAINEHRQPSHKPVPSCSQPALSLVWERHARPTLTEKKLKEKAAAYAEQVHRALERHFRFDGQRLPGRRCSPDFEGGIAFPAGSWR